MTDPTLTCPECGTEIKLTESLAGPLLAATRSEFEAKLKEKDLALAGQRVKLKTEQDQIAKDRLALESQIEQGIASERAKITAQEQEKAKKLSALDIANKAREVDDLKSVLADRENKLADAQKQQASLMKQQRQLEDQKRAMDVTIETRVAQEAEIVRAKAKLDAENDMGLRVKEKENTIAAMQKQIEDLKRRAEQGSQQLQGEILELELETTLKDKFVFDDITPIAKGEKGGDVIQSVMSPNGSFCGRILWETKRTKNWSGHWIPKLKEDQRRAQADIAIIMTAALPQEITRFGQINGIWVTDFESALSLIEALRMTLIQVANTKAVQNGQGTKMELIYEYLTGPKFQHRVEAIVEKFSDMRDDLNREKKVMTKNWAKREIQIDGVIASTIGMYGDLEGIAGRAMPEIEGLDIPLLEEE